MSIWISVSANRELGGGKGSLTAIYWIAGIRYRLNLDNKSTGTRIRL